MAARHPLTRRLATKVALLPPFHMPSRRLYRDAELLLRDAERNAQVLLAKLEAVDGGLPFKLPPRRPSEQQQQQENGEGAIVVANEVITESLVDFTSVEVRTNVAGCASVPPEQSCYPASDLG